MLDDAPGKRTRDLLGQKGVEDKKAGTNVSRKLMREETNVSTLCTNRNAGRYQQFLSGSVFKEQTCLE